jgi:hypothetical protein
MSTHVDDFFWGGTQHFEDTVIAGIGKLVTVGSTESGTFRYAGMEVVPHGTPGTPGYYIELALKEYTAGITPIIIPDTLDHGERISEELIGELRRIIGELLWVSTHTRPDVLVDVSLLGRQVASPSLNSLITANKVLRKTQSKHVPLRFVPLGPNRTVKVFTDSAWANTGDGGTQGGYTVFLHDGKRANLVGYQSRRLKRVAKSTLAGETMALVDGVDEGLCLAYLHDELMGKDLSSPGEGVKVELVRRENLGNKMIPIYGQVDCRSLTDHLNNSHPKTIDKRLMVDLQSIREDIESGVVSSVTWVPTARNPADSMTKPGAAKALVKAMEDNSLD